MAVHRHAGTIPWREVERKATDQLSAAGVGEPAVSARRMVEEATGTDGAAYLAVSSEPATVRSLAYFDGMLARRLEGEPLQYVLGRWGFRGLDLMVDRRALIPRPETEQLVEQVLVELDRRHTQEPGRRLEVVDLGTGTGAIALALATERDFVSVWATDVSVGALDVARANLAGIGRPGARVRMVEGVWYAALPAELSGAVDLIVSNPPYIADGEDLPLEVVRWEPSAALFGGPTGLEAYEAIFDGAGDWLRPDGMVAVEIAPHQVDAVGEIAGRAGFVVEIRCDLSGRERIALTHRPA